MIVLQISAGSQKTVTNSICSAPVRANMGTPPEQGRYHFMIPEAVALRIPGTQGSGPIFFGQV
jgi:hypothetical protein